MKIKDPNKYFQKKKNSLIFTGEFMEIKIRKEKIDYGMVTIFGKEVRIFDFLDMYIWDNIEDATAENKRSLANKIRYECPTEFISSPSRIEEGSISGDKFYTLQYNKHDVFMKSCVLERSATVAKKFIDLLFGGHFFDIPYNEIINVWNKCNEINGISMDVHANVLAIIVSELSRDPNNLSRSFRKALAEFPDTNMSSRVIMNVQKLPQYTSTFAAISSSDPKQGMTASIVSANSKEIEHIGSPVEDAIK